MMENKSDGQSPNKCLPTNIETLPRRLQRKILSGSDCDSKCITTAKDVTRQIQSPRLNAAGASCGVLSVSNLNIQPKQSNATRKQQQLPYATNNIRLHPPEPIKGVKWLDLQNVNTKNANLIGCIEAIKEIDRELRPLIEAGRFLEKWDDYTRLRSNLQKIFRKMLADELKFCCKENVEQYFWKALYYSSIEHMKRFDLFNLTKGEKALELINEGLSFYDELLDFLQAEYYLRIDKSESGRNEKNGISEKSMAHKNEILAKVSAQKILINLGDLCRYREQIETTGSFRKAREYYERAQELLPTNGIPYNQLAILAIYSKKKFDAVYYHMRSLMASNPIHSAKESLKVLFDEIRKKQETAMPKEIESRPQVTDAAMPMRQEVWIHPNGSRRLHRMSSPCTNKFRADEEEQLKDMDANELCKCFLLSFLHVHGKLFTGIGMENFDFVSNQMLMEFKTLLSSSPMIFTYQRLLQIVALNIFSVAYNNREEIKQSKKEIRLQAFTIGSIMFASILDRINATLSDHLFLESKDASKVLKLDAKPQSTENNPVPCSPKHNLFKFDFPNDIQGLIYIVKVWCNWLLNYDDLHNASLPCLNLDKLKQLNIEPWLSLAQFLTTINCLKRRDDLLLKNSSSDCIPIRLEEDTYLSGFAPLRLCDANLTYCHKNCDYELAKNALRLSRILGYANSLCDLENQILKRAPNELRDDAFMGYSLSALVQNVDEETTVDNQEDFEELTGFSEDLNKEFIEKTGLVQGDNENEVNICNENPEICDLIRRKNELEKKQKMQELYHQKLQTLLRKGGISLHIDVRPKYLVPDTNCFIDFLDQLRIISSKSSDKFILFVPITVVNELEGLSKGLKTSPDSLSIVENDSNMSLVTRRSKAALELIRSKNSGIKCVTTKGSILNSSVFTLEENETLISNDDKILLTALNLCKNNVDRYEDGIHYIETEVVLLTKDRNLRVKALARNLPVSHLPGFLKWASFTT